MMHGSHGASGRRIVPAEKAKDYKAPEKTIPRVRGHHEDWIEAIKTGRKAGRDFAAGRNTHSHTFYRWINEIPALPILVGVVYLVVAKPF